MTELFPGVLEGTPIGRNILLSKMPIGRKFILPLRFGDYSTVVRTKPEEWTITHGNYHARCSKEIAEDILYGLI